MPKTDTLKHIQYRFFFANKNMKPTERSFVVFLDKQTLELVQPVNEEKTPPDWNKLSFNKCRDCPLSDNDYKFCPAARALTEVVEFFSDLPSFEEVKVVVETPNRTVSAETTVQIGLRSLMGLILPTSGCPIFAKLRPMTLTHLPFSDLDETTFRAVGMYLIRQYLEQRAGGEGSLNLEGLKELYKLLHKVNVDFTKRLRDASTNDANLNSLVSLDVFTMSVPMSLDKELNKLVPVYFPELNDSDSGESCKT